MNAELLAGWYLLDAVKGFGPAKCRTLHVSGLHPLHVVNEPEILPIPGRIGEKLRGGLGAITDEQRQNALSDAKRDLDRAQEIGGGVLGYDDPDYPRRVYESNLPAPFLFVRGDWHAARDRAIACVGSRSIREPYASLQARFASYAAGTGYTIVSGFATGADTIAHEAAVDVGGSTVAVMPNGLDLVFPPENKHRWHAWLHHPGVAFVSEFRFGRRADSLALRKRNKLIVALAGAVLVGQSARAGGAMNAFRFGLEQKKAVATFADDGSEETSGNREIAQAQKVPTIAFPRTHDAAEQWGSWLLEHAAI